MQEIIVNVAAVGVFSSTLLGVLGVLTAIAWHVTRPRKAKETGHYPCE